MTSPADLLREWVLRAAGAEETWVEEQLTRLAAGATERDLHLFLGFAPRRLGKADLVLSPSDLAAADAARSGWHPTGWSIDGAARVLGLLVFKGSRPFAEMFKDLRRTADAAELVALFRGLPLYPEPESLDFEAAEALRSNLKPVFEAVAHHNPYARDHFDVHPWNHMILKALFINSDLAPIVGLDERANADLARILVEFAHERWAASRPVPTDLWRPVVPFIDHDDVRPLLDRARAEGRDLSELGQ